MTALRRIFSHSKGYFNKLGVGGIAYELVGSLLGVGASFLLYQYLTTNLLWQLAVTQSKYIFIASILSLKMESWEKPSALNPGVLLSLAIIFLPMVLLRIVQLDLYLLSLLFALLTNLHVYSLAEKKLFIPTAKAFVVPLALFLTLLSNEAHLIPNLIAAHVVILFLSIRSEFWQNIRLISWSDIVRVWSFKELIIGGILLKNVNVYFYTYLEDMRLDKIYFYLERFVRLLWGIIGVRLRTAMIAGKVYRSYFYAITMFSGLLILTKFSFIGFYLSRYLLQLQTYSGGINKYRLLEYVILVVLFVFIFDYLNCDKLIFNVVSASVLTIFILNWRATK